MGHEHAQDDLKQCPKCEVFTSQLESHICVEYDDAPCKTCGKPTTFVEVATPGTGRGWVCKDGHFHDINNGESMFFDELSTSAHQEIDGPKLKLDDAYWASLREDDNAAAYDAALDWIAESYRSDDTAGEDDGSPMTHPYRVNLWGSHPDDDNDDCWTGSTFRTLDEARKAFDDPWGHARIRKLEGWLSSFRSTTHIQVDGPDIHEVREMPNPPDDPKWKTRMDRERAREDERCEVVERRERAMEAGMGMGIDAYNEAMGWDIMGWHISDADMDDLY